MNAPPWVFFLVAVWVTAFGVFRLVVGARKSARSNVPTGSPDYRKKGMLGLSPRRHLLFGVVYLLLGGYLFAMGFGFRLI